MGICKSNPLPGGPEEIDTNLSLIKQVGEQKKNQQQDPEADAAVKIQNGIRAKKAKQDVQKIKDEMEQDKPQDWIEYKEKFNEPQQPKAFKDLVNYKPTNEDRFFPPYIRADGSIYSGQWKKGEANGFGQMLKPDGTFFKGLWRENVFYEGGLLYPNGDYFVGTSKYGQRFFAINGVIYKGEFDYGIPHGKGEEIYPDGRKSEAFYKCGTKVQQGENH